MTVATVFSIPKSQTIIADFLGRLTWKTECWNLPKCLPKRLPKTKASRNRWCVMNTFDWIELCVRQRWCCGSAEGVSGIGCDLTDRCVCFKLFNHICVKQGHLRGQRCDRSEMRSHRDTDVQFVWPDSPWLTAVQLLILYRWRERNRMIVQEEYKGVKNGQGIQMQLKKNRRLGTDVLWCNCVMLK